MEQIIKLGLIDDDKLVVQLLSDYLNQLDGLSVCLTAFSGNSLLEKLQATKDHPDIVLLDLRMEDGNGLNAAEVLIRDFPKIRIIVLSSYYKSSFMGYMLRTGVHAFLPKETDKEDLVQVIHEVYQKGHFFSEDQVTVLRSQITEKIPQLHTHSKDALSEREIEVLRLICAQFTAREIAEKLFVTTKTVEAHKSKLLQKTGVKNTAGLIIYAVQNGLVDADELVLLE
ncbi:response regulator transcription factor [bacterium SCSIO 12741]|nr:response regulator transcription factor [bacterium SCSIO 12741]